MTRQLPVRLSRAIVKSGVQALLMRRLDPGLNGALWMVATANNSRAAIGCSPFCKFSEKGVALSLDGCLQQIPSAPAQKISQWVCDRISTGEINDGSVVHGGASLNGWLDVWQRHSNQMHRRHSNRPDTRFIHSSFFPTTRQGEAMNLINAKYGSEPGLKAYTHLFDQFGPFATQVIPSTVNEAPYTLDGLLLNEAGKMVKEQ